jgi:Siphovirus Gp157
MSTVTERKPAAKPSAASLGKTADKLFDLREKKRVLESSIKEIEGQMTDLQTTLMESMESSGLEKLTASKATVSITKSIAANVEDWESFHAFIKKTGYFHLLQRRVSDPAYRELLDQGKKVPGVQPFTAKKLNLRAIS